MSSQERTAPGVWTPANVVTCVRIVLIPVFMLLALAGDGKLDGYLARSRGEVTDFGKFLDPIADKLLVFSALLLLLQDSMVSVWVVFVILVREFLVSALRMLAGSQGQVIAADGLGKAKTAVTMVSLCAFYLAIFLSSLGVAASVPVLGVARALMVAAVVLTVVSGVQYFWNARHVVFGGR